MYLLAMVLYGGQIIYRTPMPHNLKLKQNQIPTSARLFRKFLGTEAIVKTKKFHVQEKNVL